MAVTAHWIEATLTSTPAGPQYMLTLRADLIGFLRVPGHHTGEHLSTAFLHITDRIGITSKVHSFKYTVHWLISRQAWMGDSRQRTKQQHIHDSIRNRTHTTPHTFP
jgi:hypothetical protein